MEKAKNLPKYSFGKIFSIFFGLLLSASAHGQLNSIDADFTTQASPNDPQLQITDARITAQLDSGVDFGGIRVTVYTSDDFIVGQYSKSRSDMLAAGELNGSAIEINFPDVEYSSSYKVEMQAQRVDGANFAVITNNFNN